ncbi:AI-2E family transporter [Cyanobium sp. HWJ4-Hawea]|uniref:AI-2E family transporter n=1 Tax=Cyanobium sp. HWJ4-Hawea TaxID=2823713 RepID=UPI0020CF6E51|nr:AI-2E family transporter [Cyanobium sp. HWJ4-Hawea]MCP9808888.1 AI-2E family transporter [Cyanobium sp. HWJ4-Hawea]
MKFGQWLGILALVAAATLLWSLRQSLIILFAAVVVAIALCTLVNWVRQRLGCTRPVALALGLGTILLAALLIATVVIPPFVGEFSQLLAKLPDAAATLAQLLRTGLSNVGQMIYGQGDGNLSWLRDRFGNGELGKINFGGQDAGRTNWLASLMGLLGLASGLGGAVLQGLFVAAVGLMVAIQPTPYREVVVLLAPSFYRRRLRQVLILCGDALSAWMVGVLISSLCVGTLAAIGLSLLGVKLVAANAVLAGLLNIIPNIGPTLSTVFPMAVALLDAPWKSLAVLLLYITVQNLESYVITPSVMHHQLRLLPGLTLAAQLLFTVIFGPLGLLLALPMAVCLQVIVREVLIRDVLDPWKRMRPT